MASSLNKVMLMGNITRDIELRHTGSNKAVATIGLAMNHKWKTPEGEQKEEVVFVDCDAWGKTAELIAQFFAKGRPILIEGRLKLDTWQDKTTNENRTKLKVVIDNFYFVDSKAKDDAAPDEATTGEATCGRCDGVGATGCASGTSARPRRNTFLALSPLAAPVRKRRGCFPAPHVLGVRGHHCGALPWGFA